jgi:Na+:H+ antiporter, NhaA family
MVRRRLKKSLRLITEFIRLESSSGIILFSCAILALFLANSQLAPYYYRLLYLPVHLQVGSWHFNTILISWINEALMAVFFLLVGLEIKHAIFFGELNSLAKISLPAIAALGGMIVPALIYFALNWHTPPAWPGWAIPTATDIAFALGIMSLLGNRVPLNLKLFLMALAIFDDLGAIIIIAVFFHSDFSLLPFCAAILCFIVLVFFNRVQLVGALLWFSMLKSGVHPTLAGVLLAITIPTTSIKNLGPSCLDLLEQKLHPWVAYGILPLFSFANAGVSFAGIHLNQLVTSIPLGIIAGLFIGKQLGVFGATWLAVRFGWSPKLQGVNWLTIYGTALICGVGFTMSLFIGHLAFDGVNPQHSVLVRFGVLTGSLLSGIVGYYLLRRGCRNGNTT